MPKKAKTAQLQIRVTPNEKERIKKRAEAAGPGMSDWVLRTILPDVESAVQELVAELAQRRLRHGRLSRARPALAPGAWGKCGCFFNNY